MPLKVLVSAGEASGDRYAAGVVEALRRQRPDIDCFGCTGVEMRAAGVRTVVRAESLAVVGLVEVLHHIPRIYGEFRRLIAAARSERPDLAILTDSPDFHLRVAKKLHAAGIPVFYVVAPQLWAWREGRVAQLQRNVKELHCIFPFEEEFFRRRGVNAHYIGHPLAHVIGPRLSRDQFFEKHRIATDKPLITVCPGSRRGEIQRHFPALAEALRAIASRMACTFLVAAPSGYERSFFDTLLKGGLARWTSGETWDAMAHADLTLAASGTVTVEAALLGSPMVTFYQVTPLTWLLGRWLVRVPYYSMVNLVAGRGIVPELIQDAMTGEAIAQQSLRLLNSPGLREQMKVDLRAVRTSLEAGHHPFEESAGRILSSIEVGAA